MLIPVLFPDGFQSSVNTLGINGSLLDHGEQALETLFLNEFGCQCYGDRIGITAVFLAQSLLCHFVFQKAFPRQRTLHSHKLGIRFVILALQGFPGVKLVQPAVGDVLKKSHVTGVSLQILGHNPGGGVFVAHQHPFHGNGFVDRSSWQLHQFFKNNSTVVSISSSDEAFGNIQGDDALEFHFSFRVVVQGRQSNARNPSHQFIVQRFVDLLQRHYHGGGAEPLFMDADLAIDAASNFRVIGALKLPPVRTTGSPFDGSEFQVPKWVIIVVVNGFSISYKVVVEFRDYGLVFVTNVVAGHDGAV